MFQLFGLGQYILILRKILMALGKLLELGLHISIKLTSEVFLNGSKIRLDLRQLMKHFKILSSLVKLYKFEFHQRFKEL